MSPAVRKPPGRPSSETATAGRLPRRSQTLSPPSQSPVKVEPVEPRDEMLRSAEPDTIDLTGGKKKGKTKSKHQKVDREKTENKPRGNKKRKERDAERRTNDFKGEDDRFVFQGVHMLMDGSPMGAWPEGPRQSRLVFIGRNLDTMGLEDGFAACQAA